MLNKFSLLELNKTIQNTLKNAFPEAIWIVAEISELKVNRNGHCYIELIEKDVVTDNIIAKARATIWAFKFRMLKPYFENTTGRVLAAGLKILIQVNVEFHELYGFSLNVIDIDPNYTLGDLVKKKREIIAKLESDGIIDMNKELNFPLVPQRIAIISSDTAAGYQDFVDQIQQNNYGYKFYYKLFPSIMQGQQTEDSIIFSLEQIYANEEKFDVVVIIRGGGSQSDLNCFDSYNLASNIAQFPLPVLTGIGHEKDESIVDIIAYEKLKTPTAVAEFIIDKLIEFENDLNDKKEQISFFINDVLNNLNYDLGALVSTLNPLIKNIISREELNWSFLSERLKINSSNKIKDSQNKLDNYVRDIGLNCDRISQKHQNNLDLIKTKLESTVQNNLKEQEFYLEKESEKITLFNPENILKRGFTITYKNNKVVRDINQIEEKDEIVTRLFNGEVRSKIETKNNL